jgi:hypothetical protein
VPACWPFGPIAAIQGVITAPAGTRFDGRAQGKAAFVREHRRFKYRTLHGNRLGEINFSLSLPNLLPDKKFPVVVALGALVTGADRIRYVNDAEDKPLSATPGRYRFGCGVSAPSSDKRRGFTTTSWRSPDR